MDDLIKLLAELANRQPKPKGGGIVDTAEGIEFIGRKLTKQEAGDYALINSKLTDATRFTPFSIRNVGRDKRYMYIKEYSDDFVNRFEKVIQFLKDNPDVRLSQGQKDNILYNLGVYRRTIAEKNKLEKGILGEGKKLDEVYDSAVSGRPIEELTLKGALERMMKVTQDLKKKADEGEKDFVTFFSPTKKTPEQEERLAKLYYGKAYGPISSEARGLGSFNLPKLHEAGVIKLDDTIYENLKKGAHHYGGAMTFAPDPVRIWRKHFGEDIFDKMENWRYNEGEDVFSWLKRNKIEPVLKEGPKSATDYLHPVELQAELDQELKFLNVYKNPKAESSQGYMGIDDPKRLMERIGFHGENVRFLEDSLQRVDPDSYREYVRTKTLVENPTVVPFKPKEDLADGGRVNLQAGSYEPFYDTDLDINPRQTTQVPSRIKSTFDDKTKEAFRIGNFIKSQNLDPKQFGIVQAYAEDPDAFGVFNRNFFNLSQALGKPIDPFAKQGYSSDIRHGLGTSAGKDAIIDFIGSNTPLSKTGGITDALGTFGANLASLFEEGKDIFSSAKSYAAEYPGSTGIQDYDFVPDTAYLTQPLEDIAANYVGSKIPFGMSTPQKIAFLSNYNKYGGQTLDQIKNLQLQKVKNRIKAAEEEQLEILRRKKIANTPGAMTSGGGREVSTDAGSVAGAQQDISNYQSFNEVPLKKGGIVGLYI